MVIVLVIIVFVIIVVMASDIARAAPWMFETEVIWGIVAIEAIYTKTIISRGITRIFRYLRRASQRRRHALRDSAFSSPYSAHRNKKGHA
ncbi:MAG: hypothetical protein LBV73_28720 [Paraburkholderia sp.]|jgi:hypothetical protein|nr:hypothetical protein [Paraburkholderia sp.]